MPNHLPTHLRFTFYGRLWARRGAGYAWNTTDSVGAAIEEQCRTTPGVPVEVTNRHGTVIRCVKYVQQTIGYYDGFYDGVWYNMRGVSTDRNYAATARDARATPGEAVDIVPPVAPVPDGTFSMMRCTDGKWEGMFPSAGGQYHRLITKTVLADESLAGTRALCMGKPGQAFHIEDGRRSNRVKVVGVLLSERSVDGAARHPPTPLFTDETPTADTGFFQSPEDFCVLCAACNAAVLRGVCTRDAAAALFKSVIKTQGYVKAARMYLHELNGLVLEPNCVPVDMVKPDKFTPRMGYNLGNNQGKVAFLEWFLRTAITGVYLVRLCEDDGTETHVVVFDVDNRQIIESLTTYPRALPLTAASCQTLGIAGIAGALLVRPRPTKATKRKKKRAAGKDFEQPTGKRDRVV